MRIFFQLVLLISLATPILLSTGCRTYGSRKIEVTLETKPSTVHAKAFLVRFEDWAKIKPEMSILQPYIPKDAYEFRLKLEPWRVSDDLTPVRTMTYPETMIYVVEWNNKFYWEKVELAIQKRCCIRAEQ